MTVKAIKEEIRKAIVGRFKTECIVRNSDSSNLDIYFFPMVFGNDSLQYGFVWGKLHTNEYYQFRVFDIISMETVTEIYPSSIIKDYRYTSEVEIYECYDPKMLVNDVGEFNQKRDFDQYHDLESVRARIAELDPMNDDILELEHLFQNAHEILMANVGISQNFDHHYLQELYRAINITTNAERKFHFETAQSLMYGELSQYDNLKIDHLPDEWSLAPINRTY